MPTSLLVTNVSMSFRRVLTSTLSFLLLLATLGYLLSFGGTWQHLLNPYLSRGSLIALSCLLIMWIVRRMSSPWHATIFDRILIWWLPALVVSTLANMQSLRLITTGLWFVALYVTTWYIFQDGLAAEWLSPNVLVTVLLTIGIPVVITALLDAHKYPQIRVSSLLENPNNLAAFLILLIPLAITRIRQASWVIRLLLVVYIAAAGLALLATSSRGGMLGALAILGIVIAFYVHSWKLRALGLLGGIGAGVFFLNWRGDSGRLMIFAKALNVVGHHPLTGIGLFTFRWASYEILPSGGAPLYAHDLFLHVTAELGILGLTALIVTMLAVYRARPRSSDNLQLWAYAAVIGSGVQQMVDFPLMMPANALFFIIVLNLAFPPLGRSRKNAALAVEILATILLVLAFAAAPLTV